MAVPNGEEHHASRVFRIIWGLWIYALEKPIVFTVLCYGYVSIIGVIYNTKYFSLFNVRILEFYGLQDFLLGGLRTPAVLAAPLLIIIVTGLTAIALLAFDKAWRAVERRWASLIATEIPQRRWSWRQMFLRYHAFSNRVVAMTRRYDFYIIPGYLALGTLLSVTLVIWLAVDAAYERRPDYCVRISAGFLSDWPLDLVGNTQELYFFLERVTKEIEVVQRKDVQRMIQVRTGDVSCLEREAVTMR